jgi:hypothetical protein
MRTDALLKGQRDILTGSISANLINVMGSKLMYLKMILITQFVKRINRVTEVAVSSDQELFFLQKKAA